MKTGELRQFLSTISDDGLNLDLPNRVFLVGHIDETRADWIMDGKLRKRWYKKYLMMHSQVINEIR